jgi:hypothetical protein
MSEIRGKLPADGLLSDIRKLIEDARERTAVAVNRELTLLYWNIGNRIRKDILGDERAEYGSQILQTLSAKLTAEYGRGFGVSNLKYMIEFAEVFPDLQIRQSLIGELSWTHFLQLRPIKERLKREFYGEMCGLLHPMPAPTQAPRDTLRRCCRRPTIAGHFCRGLSRRVF